MKWLEKVLDFIKAIKTELVALFSFFAGRSFQRQVTALEAAKSTLRRIQKINAQRKLYNADKENIKKKWSDRRDAFIRLKRMRENSDNKQ